MSPRIILRGLFASTCQWAVMWLKRVEASRSSAPNIARDHASPPSVTVSVWGTERVAITRLRETLAQLSCRLSFSAVRGVGESEGRPGRKFEYWVVALHQSVKQDYSVQSSLVLASKLLCLRALWWAGSVFSAFF